MQIQRSYFVILLLLLRKEWDLNFSHSTSTHEIDKLKKKSKLVILEVYFVFMQRKDKVWLKSQILIPDQVMDVLQNTIFWNIDVKCVM